MIEVGKGGFFKTDLLFAKRYSENKSGQLDLLKCSAGAERRRLPQAVEYTNTRSCSTYSHTHASNAALSAKHLL